MNFGGRLFAGRLFAGQLFGGHSPTAIEHDDPAGPGIPTRRIVRRELLPLAQHAAPQPTKRARRRRDADILLLSP